MSNIINQAIRDNKMFEAILSEEDRLTIESAKIALDRFGKMNPKTAAPFKTPLVMDWAASDTVRKRAARAGTGILLATHATTAPTTGQLIIRLYMEAPGAGETLQHVIYHPVGARMFEQTLALPVLAGSWWSTNIQASGSAVGASVSFVINVG